MSATILGVVTLFLLSGCASDKLRDVSSVHRKLKAAGIHEYSLETEDDGLFELAIWPSETNAVAIPPGIPLKSLSLSGVRTCTDLQFVRSMSNLRALNIRGTKIADLSPLEGLQLRKLDMNHTDIADIGPLRGMPLAELRMVGTSVRDIDVVKTMPLVFLDVRYCRQLESIEAVRGKASLELAIEGTSVSDISPLRGMTSTSLNLNKTNVRDLSPLKGMPLENLYASDTKIADISSLKGMPLSWLDLSNTMVRDISALKDAPLQVLSISGTSVADIAVVKNMPLEVILVADTPIADLSPVKQCPLLEIAFSPESVTSGIAVLRSITTLQRINGMPVEEFWASRDAGGK